MHSFAEDAGNEFSLSKTFKWSYPETVIITNKTVLDNFTKFIFEKVRKLHVSFGFVWSVGLFGLVLAMSKRIKLF